MNMLLKSAVAAVLVLGGAAANALTAPSSGASDLVLIIKDTSTTSLNNTYVLDTGISVSSLMPSLVTGAVLNTSLPQISKTIQSPGLQAFLNTNDTYVWTFEAAAYTSSTTTGAKVPGAMVGIFTTTAGDNAVKSLLLTKVTNYATSLSSEWLNTGNMIDQLAAGTAVGVGGTEVIGTFDTLFPNMTKYGMFSTADDVFTLSSTSSASLYGVTGNGAGQVPATQTYILGSVSIDKATGTFSINPTSGVPLPAAVWLLGSGLLGLAGVSRRRRV